MKMVRCVQPLLLAPTFARHVVVEYKTDKLGTIEVEFSSLLAFLFTHFTVSIFPHSVYQLSFFVSFVFPFDVHLFFISFPR